MIDHDLPDPFADHPDARLVVTRKSKLALVPITDGANTAEPIYVQDADSTQALRLLEQRGSAVVRLRHGSGSAVADLLTQHFGPRIRRVSQTVVTVRVDGASFEAGDVGSPLISQEREWLLDVMAALVELRSSRFRRLSGDAIRRAIGTARRIRLVLAHNLETLVDGEEVELQQAGGHVLALPDDRWPTVVLQRQDDIDARGLLERSAPAVAELIGYPDLGDTFRVTLIDLLQPDWDGREPPTLQKVARVLGEPEERSARDS